MKWKEWEEEMKSRSGDELIEYSYAIDTLESWEAFNREYGWTQFSLIGSIIKGEQERRQKKAEVVSRLLSRRCRECRCRPYDIIDNHIIDELNDLEKRGVTVSWGYYAGICAEDTYRNILGNHP